MANPKPLNLRHSSCIGNTELCQRCLIPGEGSSGGEVAFVGLWISFFFFVIYDRNKQPVNYVSKILRF